MFSWTQIRIFCAILLVVPVVHFAYLLSRETLAVLDSSTNAWASEMEAYAKTDRANHLPEDPVVVVGGRRVKLWRDLPDMLAEKPVLMRGLGDATVEDITQNYERLIGFYRPEIVIFLPSNSEFHIRDDKSANDFVKAVQALIDKDGAHSITQQFYLISPIKTPLYSGDGEKIDEISREMASWGARHAKVTYLDVNAILQTSDGKPNPRYFRNDGVNLNDSGYARLSLLLKANIEGRLKS
jgi:lysophospholipase L1-like esterase